MWCVFVAQIETVDPKTFIENNRAVSKAVRESLNQTWVDAYQGPLYKSIAFLGAVFAVMFIGIWTAQFLRQHLGDGDTDRVAKSIDELVIPFVLVILLAPPVSGSTQEPLLGTLTLAARNFTIQASDFILSNLSSEIGAEPIAEAGVKTLAQSTAANAIVNCAGLPEKDARTNCLISADEKVQQILQPYSGTRWAPPLYNQLQEQIIFAMDNPNDYGTSNWLGRLFGGLGTAVQPISSQAILGITMAIGAAFVVALEISQLITGLVGPLFLGISLIPIPATPWVTWLIYFFGISFVDICYKILVGYTAVTVLNAGPTDPLIYPLIISIMGVFLALILATGGGISLFSALARAGAQLSSKLN